MFVDERNAILIFFTYDNPLRMLQHHTEQGTDAGRTCADDQDRILFCDFRDSRSPVSGCEHISDEECLAVRHAVRYLI